MTSAPSTPGPWYYNETLRNHTVRIPNENWSPGFPRWRILTLFTKCLPDAKGNALLIAEAPSMREALRDLITHIKAMQADTAIDASTDCGGILHGDAIADAIENAQAILTRIDKGA